ncbi:hypothetical protein [Streptomyces sp. NPDC049906]|uniref:hypothetical protein n=1 Tax=Streptomyces sp. NPDC049906 TaxID=3155656 RepID=UPI00341F74C1
MAGVGQQLGELKAGAEEPAADGPVFVDETGRRSRLYRRIGMAVVVGCAVYACVIVATVVSGNSSAPWLPMTDSQAEPAGKVDVSPRPADPASPTASPSIGASTAPSQSAVTDPVPAADTRPATGRTREPAAGTGGAAAPEATVEAPAPQPTGSTGPITRPDPGPSRSAGTGGVDEGPGASEAPDPGASPSAPVEQPSATPSGEAEQPPGDGTQPLGSAEDAP